MRRRLYSADNRARVARRRHLTAFLAAVCSATEGHLLRVARGGRCGAQRRVRVMAGVLMVRAGERTSRELEMQLAALRPGEHLCMLYDTEAEQLGALVPFLLHGL